MIVRELRAVTVPVSILTRDVPQQDMTTLKSAVQGIPNSSIYVLTQAFDKAECANGVQSTPKLALCYQMTVSVDCGNLRSSPRRYKISINRILLSGL